MKDLEQDLNVNSLTAQSCGAGVHHVHSVQRTLSYRGMSNRRTDSVAAERDSVTGYS